MPAPGAPEPAPASSGEGAEAPDLRILIFCCRGLNSYLLLADLLKVHAAHIAGVVWFPILPPAKLGEGRSRAVIRRLRASPLPFQLFQGLVYFGFEALAALRGGSLRRTLHRRGIDVIRFTGYDSATLDWIAERRATIIINTSAMILDRRLIEPASLGVLNCHAAPLPEFRGPGNAFWMLTEGVTKVSGTIHYVTEGIDSGPIIARTEEVAVRTGDSVFSVWLQLRQALAVQLHDVIGRLARGERPPGQAQDERHACTRSFPDAEAVRGVRARGYPILRLADIFVLARIALAGK